MAPPPRAWHSAGHNIGIEGLIGARGIARSIAPRTNWGGLRHQDPARCLLSDPDRGRGSTRARLPSRRHHPHVAAIYGDR